MCLFAQHIWYFLQEDDTSPCVLQGACPFSCQRKACVVLMQCHQVALQVHFAFSFPQLLSPEGTGGEQKNHVLLLLHFREKTRLVNKK